MTWITRQQRHACLIVLMLCLCLWKSVLCIDCNVTINISSMNPEGYISSPSFPSSYSKLSEPYSCWVTLMPDDPARHILITFDDFHLSSNDNMSCESQEIDQLVIYSVSKTIKSCGCQRPHVLDIQGGEFRFKLQVQASRIDDAAFRVYRAKYQYLTATEYMNLRSVYFYSHSAKPEFNNDYGVIERPAEPLPTFFNSEDIDVLYYMEVTAGMKISVTAVFRNNGDGSSILEIRDGITSQASRLYMGSLDTRTSVISSQESLYVRWTGRMRQGSATILMMAYTAFKDPVSLGTCESSDYFYCNNHRCIKTTLTCDSVDNCGDGSDETKDRPEDICHGNTNCESAPCKNGATCQPYSSSPGVHCVCLDGFFGPFCEGYRCMDSDDCLNYGSCIGGECICETNYYGRNCEYYDNTTTNTDYTDLQHTSIMIGAFVGAVCLLSICWLIAMARKRQTDEPLNRIQRIISVHSRDERGMRPSVTTAGSIDLPPTYSDCVDETATPLAGKQTVVPPITEETLDEDVFTAEEDGPPLSPPPTYESVALSEEEDGIVFEVNSDSLPDVVSRDRTPRRQTAHTDTVV